MSKFIDEIALEYIKKKIMALSGDADKFLVVDGDLVRKYDIPNIVVSKAKEDLIRKLIDECVSKNYYDYSSVELESYNILTMKLFSRDETKRISLLVYLFYCIAKSDDGFINIDLHVDTSDITKFVAIINKKIEVLFPGGRTISIRADGEVILEFTIKVPCRFCNLDIVFRNENDKFTEEELNVLGIVEDSIERNYSSLFATVDMLELLDEHGFVPMDERDFYKETLTHFLGDRVKYISFGYNIKPRAKRILR